MLAIIYLFASPGPDSVTHAAKGTRMNNPMPRVAAYSLPRFTPIQPSACPAKGIGPLLLRGPWPGTRQAAV